MLLSGDCPISSSASGKIGIPVLLRTSSSKLAFYSPTIMVYFPDMSYWCYLITGLAIVFMFIEMLLLTFHLIGILYAKLFMFRKPTNVLRDELPGISILKPLCGTDVNLPSNLESYFQLDYPRYELLICIQDEGDPAIKVVEPLMEKYPHIDARLFLGGSKVGINPKVNNMLPGYKVSKYDIIMISDSGISISPTTLTEMVTRMTPKVGMVHGLPFVHDRAGFSSTLDKVYFGGAHARMYITACVAGVNCVSGMLNIIRKSILEEAGGMSQFAKYISEDYYMGIATFKSGYVQRLSPFPAMQNSGSSSLKSFRKRMVRWTMVRISTVPTTLILEPLTECLVLGVAASWAASYLFSWDPIIFFICHILQWFALDYMQLKVLQRGPLNFTKVDYALAWLYREVMTIFYFWEGAFSQNVTWRTGTYRLRWGGYLEEC
ncbi:ceramide glucosyltransferase-like [Diadema antillarum]|uniref:ceramide glucosyltransferase-like n=1 Tax=Diadema antillarum TaxID=105358 RepID=UPI003A859F12